MTTMRVRCCEGVEYWLRFSRSFSPRRECHGPQIKERFSHLDRKLEPLRLSSPEETGGPTPGLAVDNPSVMSGGENYMGSGLFFSPRQTPDLDLDLGLERGKEKGREL
jgi:hypothetical protein